MFYVSAGVYATGAFVYLFFASARLQDWVPNNEELSQNGLRIEKPVDENHLNEYNNKGFVTN